MRKTLLLPGLALLLSGCASGETFLKQSFIPWGNPNQPAATSETAQRALGHTPQVTVLQPQAGDVWPGPVQPMPTLSEVQKNADLPLGQGYVPSLPSPYPPGQAPAQQDPDLGGPLYRVQDGVPIIPPAVPGDTR